MNQASLNPFDHVILSLMSYYGRIHDVSPDKLADYACSTLTIVAGFYLGAFRVHLRYSGPNAGTIYERPQPTVFDNAAVVFLLLLVFAVWVRTYVERQGDAEDYLDRFRQASLQARVLGSIGLIVVSTGAVGSYIWATFG